MAFYGLQTDFMNVLLKQYFGLDVPNFEKKDIFVGLGLQQEGSNVNIESFDEVFAGRPLAGYERARAVFGVPEDGTVFNVNDITFPAAVEAWATTKPVTMIGLFDTLNYEDEQGNMIKPLIVLALPQGATVSKGEVVMLAKGVVRLSLSDI